MPWWHKKLGDQEAIGMVARAGAAWERQQICRILHEMAANAGPVEKAVLESAHARIMERAGP